MVSPDLGKLQTSQLPQIGRLMKTKTFADAAYTSAVRDMTETPDPVRAGGAAARTPILAAEGVHTYYGASHVLQGVNFHIHPGEAVGLMGRNGMG
jgi:ATPase subunit of ABC transporter with duplicated ATPase domains